MTNGVSVPLNKYPGAPLSEVILPEVPLSERELPCPAVNPNPPDIPLPPNPAPPAIPPRLRQTEQPENRRRSWQTSLARARFQPVVPIDSLKLSPTPVCVTPLLTCWPKAGPIKQADKNNTAETFAHRTNSDLVSHFNLLPKSDKRQQFRIVGGGLI